MARRADGPRRLTFEGLESKMMLSADIGVEVANGDLIIRGTRADDDITLIGGGGTGTWTVDPGPNGSVDGRRAGKPVVFSGVSNDIHVYLRRGKDEFSIKGCAAVFDARWPQKNDIGGSLIVKGSHEGNVIQITDLKVGHNTIIRTREGSDEVEIRHLETGGNLAIKTAGGDDRVSVQGTETWSRKTVLPSMVGGDMIVHAGGGWYDDSVQVGRTVVENDLLIRSTRGDNFYSLSSGIEVGNRLRLFGGEGNDSIHVGMSPIFYISAEDTVSPASAQDDESDPLFVTEIRQLQIRTFGGNDRVDVPHANVQRHVRAFLGEGDDCMTIVGSHVEGNCIISGGAGNDYLSVGNGRETSYLNRFQGTAWFDGGEGADDTLRYRPEDEFHRREWTNWETIAEIPPYTGLQVHGWPSDTSVSHSVNSFGLDLYEEIQDREGNLFFSPLSISTALAMVYAGADGETARQMADVLHFHWDDDALHAAFGELLDDLNTVGEESDFDLSVVNALWSQEGFSLPEDYLNLIRTNYDGGLKEVDFITNVEAARQTINGWVEENTEEKIQDLIPEGILQATTRLVLTNAVYFQNEWARHFNPDRTGPGAFRPESGEPVVVSMMHETAGYRYMERDGFQVLELPYEGGEQSMVILLPEEAAGGVDLDATRIPDDLADWLGWLESRQVSVTLPQFEITDQLDLKDILQSMGMADLFMPYADLSGIGPGLKVEDVLHKAFVEVDEAGTTAAAATAVVVVGATSVSHDPPPIAFVADHPFHFLIRDNVSETILFMGRVSNPDDGAE